MQKTDLEKKKMKKKALQGKFQLGTDNFANKRIVQGNVKCAALFIWGILSVLKFYPRVLVIRFTIT